MTSGNILVLKEGQTYSRYLFIREIREAGKDLGLCTKTEWDVAGCATHITLSGHPFTYYPSLKRIQAVKRKLDDYLPGGEQYQLWLAQAELKVSFHLELDLPWTILRCSVWDRGG